jgi:PAS domain S-box-containing protein
MKQRNQLLSAALRSIGDAVLATDTDGRITLMNPVAEALTGWDEKDAIGRSVADVFRIVNEKTGKPAVDPVAEVIRKGVIVGLANHTILIAKDGTERAIDDSGAPIRDDDGNLHGVILVFRDVSERRQLARCASAQYQVGALLAESPDLDVAPAQILEAIGETLEWEVGAFWTVEPSGELIRAQATWRRRSKPVTEFEVVTARLAFKSGVGLPGRVWESGEPAWVLDVLEDDNFPRAPYATAAGLRAALAFPLTGEGQVLGVIEFFSRTLKPPDIEMLRTVATFGSQIGQFITRRRAEDALRESEARMAAIIAAALDCIITINHHGRVLEWNPAAETTFGYPRLQAIGQELSELIVPTALRESHRKGIAHYLATGEGPVIGQRIEMPAVRADGTGIDVELTVIRDASADPPVFTGFVRDITEVRREQVRAEAAAREIGELNARLQRAMNETHHRVKNNLQVISALVEMQVSKTGESVPASHLKRLNQHIRALAEIHDLLTVQAKAGSDTEYLYLAKAMERLMPTLQESLEGRTIHSRIEDVRVPVRHATSIAVLLNELVTNAIKHGAGDIHVSFTADDKATLVIYDEGPGFSKGFDPKASASTGLELIQSLVEWDLSGKIRFENRLEGGAIITIEFPRPREKAQE